MTPATTDLPGNLREWIQGDLIESKEEGIVTVEQAVERVGDSQFLSLDNWGLVRLGWQDPLLFHFLYGWGKISDFEAVAENEEWKRRWLHRRAGERVQLMRGTWASNIYIVCRLRMVGGVDGRWVRRINAEHFSEYVNLLLAEGKVGSEALQGARLLVNLAEAVQPDLGRRVSTAVEDKYQKLYNQREVSKHLKDANVGDGKELDRERKALSRELAYFWNWARNIRSNDWPKQRILPGMTISIPKLLGGGVVVAEVLQGHQLRMVVRLMEGEAKVRRIVDRLALVFEDLANALVDATRAEYAPLEGLSQSLVTAFGFDVVAGRLQGRLCRRWDVRVTETLLTSEIFGDETPPLSHLKTVVKPVGKQLLAAAGLVENSQVSWIRDGVGLTSNLREQCQRVATERLMLSVLARSGYEVPEFKAGKLAAVNSTFQRGTIFREVMSERIPKKDAHYWKELEENKGTALVTESYGDARLLSLYDGLAAGFLEILGFGKKPLGDFAIHGFWDHPDDDPVGMADFWILRDALLAANTWATAQLLGNGHHWLGLSSSYRRSLAAAFRQAANLVEVQVTQKLMRGGQNLFEGLEPQKRSAFLSTIMLKSDGLFGKREKSFEFMGITFPTQMAVGNQVVQLVLYTQRSAEEYLTGGHFWKTSEGFWEYRDQTGGVMIPGLESPNEARALGQLSKLWWAGVDRYRRALFVVNVIRQKDGAFPTGLSPIVPLDLGDCEKYVLAVEASGGLTLNDLIWQKHGLLPLPDQKVAHEFAKAFMSVNPPMPGEIDPMFSERFTWGLLKRHWEFVGSRPSLAQVGKLPLSPVANILRSFRHLPRGYHPLTVESLSTGGGAPQEIHSQIKKIWGMFYSTGRVPDAVSPEAQPHEVSVMAEHVRSFWCQNL